MVTRTIAALAAMATCTPALAQASPAAADWSRAGGSLFAGVALHTVHPLEPDGLDTTASSARPVDAVVRAPVQPYALVVDAAAARHGLDPKLLHALVVVESAYRPRAVSRAGAVGLTQLMTEAAAELGVTDREDPAASLGGGADYLARQIVRFGDLRLALAAYNAGPARVARLGRVPAIPETRAYVAAVVDCYLALSAGRDVRNAGDCASSEGRRS